MKEMPFQKQKSRQTSLGGFFRGVQLQFSTA
jgi:hypothetical protein